jgi:hypothetical protein
LWKYEAESVRELVDIEPDSKWALLTMVYLMRDIVEREESGVVYDESVGWIDKVEGI